jgi:hypothetical protein
VTSYTTTATLESRMYEGIRDLKRSCPAVSHSCNRTVRSSRYIVYPPMSALYILHVVERRERTFDKKSIPMVAWYVLSKVSYMKRVIRDVLPTMHFHISPPV